MSIAAKYRPYYTYDDYCQWEGQWELIEGMPYAMAPMPVPEHQRTAGLLFMLFEKALSDYNHCKVYLPLAWKIAEDTVVQPDVLIVFNKIEKKFLDFPPVLVVEILSPSTAAKDRGEKMELYLLQKVKYYLIVDPKFKKVEVYELMDGEYKLVSINPENYSFNLHTDCTASIELLNIWD
jgi:Uma2 family endonuclease